MRFFLLVGLAFALVGCGEHAERDEWTCAPTHWDEDAVRDALGGHVGSVFWSPQVRPLVWDEVRLPAPSSATVADSADFTRVLAWVEGRNEQHLALLLVDPSGSRPARLDQVRAFDAPITPTDAEPFLDPFESGWDRWLAGARAVRPVALRGALPPAGASVCYSAWEDLMDGVDGQRPPGTFPPDLSWLHRRLSNPAKLGSQIFQAQACNVCHSIDGSHKVGPSMAGMMGIPRPLHPDGEAVLADRAYIARSIREPAADSLCGYPLAMPAYPALSDYEVAALLAYIDSLPEPSSREDRAEPGAACLVPALPQRAL